MSVTGRTPHFWGGHISSTVSRPAYQAVPSVTTARLSLRPACPRSRSVCLRPSPASVTTRLPGSESRSAVHSWATVGEACIHLSTPGVLGSGSSSVVSIHHGLLRPHAPVPQARCDFACCLYAAPSLCGSASATRGTFPTFTAVLAMHVADPTPAVRRIFPLYSYDDSRLPQSMNESSPAIPSLPAITDGLCHFGAASFT